MKTRIVWIIVTVIMLLAGIAQPALADGIIIPDPPIPCPNWNCEEIPQPMNQLVIRYHHVDVRIENQIARVHVDQVFFNPNDWEVEGIYLFPMPVDATVTNFVLWVDGKPVQGKVLDAQEARQTYEQIVSQMRDPALLEYVNRGAFQAFIYPIPSQGERRIELEYSQPLTADAGLVKFVYPLNTEKFSGWPIESVRVTVTIDSQEPIRAVYSPSHPVATYRENEKTAKVSYEEVQALPDKDFALYYSIGTSQAMHLLTYRDPSAPDDKDGTFMLLLAPGQPREITAVAKDVILVLDRSGSMDGEKFRQAQSAVRYVLENLNPQDRFYLSTFSSGVENYSRRLEGRDQADNAARWMAQMSASGSTDINRALLEASAVVDRGRPAYLIFLTDGLPTEGVTDSKEILNNFLKTAPSNLRFFSFGVGWDVDTILLDSLSQENHGLSYYVQPGEDLNEKVSAFYSKINSPVLTDVRLDFGRMQVYDVFPAPMPDLFSGTQVVITGRYKEGGTSHITLRGKSNDGENTTFSFENQRFESDSREKAGVPADLPRIWATRKIGYLLNQIRLEGANAEIIEQIVRLSVRYGIVTPYTSYLVTEPAPVGEANMQRIAQEAFESLQAMPTQSFGQDAVEKAAGQGAMSQAEVVPSLAAAPGEDTQRVRVVGSRTFVLTDGVWVDTQFDPQQMRTTKVSFLSQDYFNLAAQSSELSGAFALGDRVIVVSSGIVYESITEGKADSIKPMTKATEISTPEKSFTNPQSSSAYPTPVVDPDETNTPETPILEVLISFLPWIGLIGVLFLAALIALKRM
jgi:Ca-activated chloride channel family protein